MSFNRKMILKHWRISISWISKTERGIVSKGGVKYFTNLSSSTMARQGTGQPLCDPLPLTFPLLFPPPPPVSISSRAMLILAETIQYWQWCIPRKVTCLLFLIIRTFFRGPNSWHVLVVVEKRDILLSINARKVYQYDWWSPEQLHKHHQHLVYDQARLRYR